MFADMSKYRYFLQYYHTNIHNPIAYSIKKQNTNKAHYLFRVSNYKSEIKTSSSSK